jgi:hypothetical protein
MSRTIISTLVVIAINLLRPTFSAAQQGEQLADPKFDASVEKSSYPKSHPRILIDEAHHNFHTASGRYKPFADLVTNDGCKVTPNKKEFTEDSLKAFDVLVIANALGAERMGTAKAESPAFTEDECDAVRDWVKAGGALLLITDHYPTGSAAEVLARRFDVDFSRGMSEEYTFTPDTGLGDHAILSGRNKSERIQKVGTFTGQTLKGPPGSTEYLKLPDDAMEKVPDPTNPFKNKPLTHSAKGRCQAVAMKFGKGRVVVMGEAGMFSAQLGPDGHPFGMNVKGIDNKQLALNTIHWLTRLLDPDAETSKGTPRSRRGS